MTTKPLQLTRAKMSRDPQDLDALANLRRKVYEIAMPHMLKHPLLDEGDARAHHCLLYEGNELIGALRLLPAPFEAEKYFQECESLLRPDAQMLEIGRFVILPEKQGSGNAKLLLAQAISWLIEDSNYDGILGYARASKVGLFVSLGMEELAQKQSLESKSPEPYSLMAAYRDMPHAFKDVRLK
jgi:predicted GNAT family N-acyltransferase